MDGEGRIFYFIIYFAKKSCTSFSLSFLNSFISINIISTASHINTQHIISSISIIVLFDKYFLINAKKVNETIPNNINDIASLRIALKSAGHSGGKLPPAQPM